MSGRQTCKLLGMDRGSYRYEPQPRDDGRLREEMVALAKQKPRYRHRRLGVLLKRRGLKLNHKKLYPLYREEHLAVRRLRRKRLLRPAGPMAQLNGRLGDGPCRAGVDRSR